MSNLLPPLEELITKKDALASAPIIGTFTLDKLPMPTDHAFKYAAVTDLGGGADMVLSDGTNWKHIRRGAAQTVTVSSSNLNITPLSSPSILVLGGTINSASTITLMPTNIYPGYELTVVVPAGVISTVLGLVGSLGLKLGGGPTLPVANGTWADYSYNGINLVKIRGGSL